MTARRPKRLAIVSTDEFVSKKLILVGNRIWSAVSIYLYNLNVVIKFLEKRGSLLAYVSNPNERSEPSAFLLTSHSRPGPHYARALEKSENAALFL